MRSAGNAVIDPRQLRDLVILPVLQALADTELHAATELMLGTAMQETHCGDYLAQVGGGPALGLWQMEPATEADLWTNYLKFRPALGGTVRSFVMLGMPRVNQLVGNAYYACAMARVLYMRAPGALPPAGNPAAQAAYYVHHYNAGGKATVEEYVDNWHALQAKLT